MRRRINRATVGANRSGLLILVIDIPMIPSAREELLRDHGVILR